MTDTIRKIRDDGLVSVAVDASIEIEAGDLTFLNTDDARPFSSITDQGTEELNQQYAAARFLGVASVGKKGTSAAGTALIDVNPLSEHRFVCPSTTWEIGDLVGASEDSGTTVADQQVEKVTNAAEAIGVCVEKATSATTVRCLLFPRVTGLLSQLGASSAIDGINVQTLAAELALSAYSPRSQYLDPGGADRDVLLPTEASSEGKTYYIANAADADEVLNVKEDSDTTVQAYLRRGEQAMFTSTGSAWLVRRLGYLTGASQYGLPVSETLAGAKVLVDSDAQMQRLDPGGSTRTVDLPAVTANTTAFVIVNTADMAEDLTVRLTGGGATVVTISQSEEALLIVDGTNWVPLLGKAT